MLNEIGRVIQRVEDMGQPDNTLIIYINGDNGASSEGTLDGTPNEFTFFNGVAVPVKGANALVSILGVQQNFPALCSSMGLVYEYPIPIHG